MMNCWCVHQRDLELKKRRCNEDTNPEGGDGVKPRVSPRTRGRVRGRRREPSKRVTARCANGYLFERSEGRLPFRV
jgi:hypothetical protein